MREVWLIAPTTLKPEALRLMLKLSRSWSDQHTTYPGLNWQLSSTSAARTAGGKYIWSSENNHSTNRPRTGPRPARPDMVFSSWTIIHTFLYTHCNKWYESTESKYNTSESTTQVIIIMEKSWYIWLQLYCFCFFFYFYVILPYMWSQIRLLESNCW